MSIVLVNGNVSDFISQNDDWFLVHVENQLHFYGQHTGRITAGLALIEYFNTEQDTIDRAEELGIELAEVE